MEAPEQLLLSCPNTHTCTPHMCVCTHRHKKQENVFHSYCSMNSEQMNARFAGTLLLLLISFLRQFPNLFGSGRPGDHSSRKLSVRATAQNSPLCLSLLIKPAFSLPFLAVLFYNPVCLGDMPISMNT